MPKRIELKVGLFVIITILLMVTSGLYIAYKKDFFSRVYTFTLLSRSGEGFSVGMPVVFSGFTIGKVKSLELNEKGLVIIKISVPERHVRWIHSDSVFILDRPLIGSPKIAVYTDNLETPQLSTDTSIEVFSIDSINELVQKTQPVLDKVDAILKNIETITSSLARRDSLLDMAVGDRKTVGAVRDALKNINTITQSINSILTRVDSMTVKTDHEIFDTQGLFSLVKIILNDIIIKLEKLNAVTDKLPEIAGDISESTGGLDVLRQDIDMALDSTNLILNDVERMIPFKKERNIKLP